MRRVTGALSAPLAVAQAVTCLVTWHRFNSKGKSWMLTSGREGTFATNFPELAKDEPLDVMAFGGKQLSHTMPQAPQKPDAFVEQEEHEALMERDLVYEGYSPVGLATIKRMVMTFPQVTRAQLEAADKDLKQLAANMEFELEAGDQSSGAHRLEAGVQGWKLDVDSINHVRYVRLIALRRLGLFKEAVAQCREMINADPNNMDAIESHVEICLSGPEGLSLLNSLLNGLRKAGMNEEGIVVNEAPYEAAITFMADSLIGYTVHQVNEEGEGTATKALSKALEGVLSVLRGGNREGEVGLLVQSIMDAVDEQIENAAFRQEAHLQIQTMITVLRTLLVMELFKEAVDDRGGMEFLILVRLQTTLRMMGRLRECSVFAERMIRHMRSATQYCQAPTPEAKAAVHIQGYDPRAVPPEELAAHMAALRDCKFQYVHDMAVMSPNKAMNNVVRLVEEYPTFGVPWKILALVMHSEGRKPDAVVACRKAVEVDPTDASSILLLGNLYLELRKFDIAAHLVESFRVMERLGPEALMEQNVELPEGTPQLDAAGAVEASKARRSEIALDALQLEEGLQQATDFTADEIEKLEKEYMMQMHRATLYTFQGQTPHNPQVNRVPTNPGETPSSDGQATNKIPQSWKRAQQRRHLAAARLLQPPEGNL